MDLQDAIRELLIEQPLRRARPGDNLSTVVRAQTLAVLAGLDPNRKRILLQFLHESGLIHRDKPVVSLVAANLSRANLSEADLSGANLGKAVLSKVDLSWADLSGAFLGSANLSGAGGITNEKLEQRALSLKEAIMPDGSQHP